MPDNNLIMEAMKLKHPFRDLLDALSSYFAWLEIGFSAVQLHDDDAGVR
jgi:hypothetical protein